MKGGMDRCLCYIRYILDVPDIEIQKQNGDAMMVTLMSARLP